MNSLNNRGLSLIEMVISLVIVTIGFLGIYTVVVHSDVLTKSNRKEVETLADFSLMKISLNRIIPRLYFGQIFLNSNIVTSLVNGSFAVDPDRGSYYSIIPFHKMGFAAPPVVGTPLSYATMPDEYEMVLFIGPRNEENALTVDGNPLNATAPYDFTDPNITSGTVAITGPANEYSPGELVAITAAQGTQIVRINSISAHSMTFETLGPCMVGYYEANMPLGILTKGNQITKLSVYLLGVESTTRHLYFLRLNPGTANFDIMNRIPEKITSLQVNDIITKTRIGMDIAPLSAKAILKATMQLEGTLKNSRRSTDLQFLF